MGDGADQDRASGASPWIVTFEYGGVGPLWEALTDADALRTQVPRLRRIVANV